jgi:hypothetical protein
MAQQERRGPGRPRQPKTPQSKVRKDITLSQRTLDFIDWLIGEDGNLSGFLEEQAQAHPSYQIWLQRQKIHVDQDNKT